MADVKQASTANREQQSDDRPAETSSEKRPRVWPAVLIVATYWILVVVLTTVADGVISTTFMTSAAGCLLATLLFAGWWLLASRVPWVERFGMLALAIAVGTGAVLVSLQTLSGMGAVFFGLPLLLSAWTAWLLVCRGRSVSARRIGLAAVIFLVWGLIAAIRVDGLDGAMMPDVHWRWTPTAEQLYLSSRAKADDRAAPAANAIAAEPLVLEAGDWPGFRGPNSLGEQQHEPIATDWNEHPPKLVWRRPIGPSWSSFVVIGSRLFTSEQRGQEEFTVCLEAATGDEIWAHAERARFWDGQAGTGPRATPTFHGGRLYTYGASGVLNCLDASTGKPHWTVNVLEETKAPLPMWGFSSSPLIVDGLVIVYAGGPDDKGLVAYRVDSGEPAWSAPTGPISYCSAQLITIDGQPQVALLSDTGVVAVEPTSGRPLWNYDANGHGVWRVVQPRGFGDSQVLVGSEDIGLALLDVARSGDGWKATETWVSNQMRPAFNDFVIVDRYAYGFDKGLFCCLDLETGKRKWKGGRYGFGQVLLLKPQNVMIVLSEQGDVILLAANPEKHEELDRFSALSSKTWNHPVVAHGHLYVRNDREMAAYDLAPAQQ